MGSLIMSIPISLKFLKSCLVKAPKLISWAEVETSNHVGKPIPREKGDSGYPDVSSSEFTKFGQAARKKTVKTRLIKISVFKFFITTHYTKFSDSRLVPKRCLAPIYLADISKICL
jgi:hypothetical protein